jgi:hypothetical protein
LQLLEDYPIRSAVLLSFLGLELMPTTFMSSLSFRRAPAAPRLYRNAVGFSKTVFAALR